MSPGVGSVGFAEAVPCLPVICFYYVSSSAIATWVGRSSCRERGGGGGGGGVAPYEQHSPSSHVYRQEVGSRAGAVSARVAVGVQGFVPINSWVLASAVRLKGDSDLLQRKGSDEDG